MILCGVISKLHCTTTFIPSFLSSLDILLLTKLQYHVCLCACSELAGQVAKNIETTNKQPVTTAMSYLTADEKMPTQVRKGECFSVRVSPRTDWCCMYLIGQDIVHHGVSLYPAWMEYIISTRKILCTHYTIQRCAVPSVYIKPVRISTPAIRTIPDFNPACVRISIVCGHLIYA